jgi:hypothetical protein
VEGGWLFNGLKKERLTLRSSHHQTSPCHSPSHVTTAKLVTKPTSASETPQPPPTLLGRQREHTTRCSTNRQLSLFSLSKHPNVESMCTSSRARRHQMGICHLPPVRRKSMMRAALHFFLGRLPHSILSTIRRASATASAIADTYAVSSTEPPPTFLLRGLKRRLRLSRICEARPPGDSSTFAFLLLL